MQTIFVLTGVALLVLVVFVVWRIRQQREWGFMDLIKHPELWQELIDASARHRVEWHWVKGHSGHPENDRVDALACAAADDQRRHHRL